MICVACGIDEFHIPYHWTLHCPDCLGEEEE